MAAEGTLFTDFYAASAVCSPSRGALLTGCYPPRIGFGEFEGEGVLFPGQGVGLNPSERTVAGVLRKAGYATRIIGKWHCGDQPPFLPINHGFDGYYGIPYSNDMGLQAGKSDSYRVPLPLLRDGEVIEAQLDQASVTGRYVEDAVTFLRANRDRPFFLYFAHMYVHLPLYVQDRFLRESANGPYGAGVAAIDWATGVIFAELKRLGIDRNTLVLFTSDNGSRNDFGPSCGNLRGRKGTTWEGGQRVPFIARWPGTVPAGRVNHDILSNIDLLPTLAALAGAALSPEPTIDGVDASALLTGRAERPPRTEFWYYLRNDLEAVRVGDWKLHLRKRGEQARALYNLREDCGESADRLSFEPETVALLEAAAERARAAIGDGATGTVGDCRPIGRIDEPQPLTRYDPDYPYFMAEYDLTDAG